MTPSLRELAWVIARDVNRTVGGGIASMELLRRSFGSRQWLDESTHALMVAVSRLTPGTNILAYCAAVGWRFQGWRGTVTAVAAASVPGSVIIFALAATLVRLDRYPAVRVLLGIGMLVAAGLILSSAWALLRPYVRTGRWRRALVIVAIAGAFYAAGWTPVRILLVSAMAGALLPLARPPAARRERDGTPVRRDPAPPPTLRSPTLPGEP